MIGIDTNVLLRHTLDDDAAQSPLATAFLNDDGRLAAPALVNPVVLVEFVWTLSRREGFGKADILALLDVLVASRRAGSPSRRSGSRSRPSRRGERGRPTFRITSSAISTGRPVPRPR